MAVTTRSRKKLIEPLHSGFLMGQPTLSFYMRLQDQSSSVRMDTMEEVVTRGFFQAFKAPLRQLLEEDVDWEVRRKAYRTLWSGLSPQERLTLLTAADDDSPEVRLEVIHLLGFEDSREAIPVLVGLASDEAPEVAVAAFSRLLTAASTNNWSVGLPDRVYAHVKTRRFNPALAQSVREAAPTRLNREAQHRLLDLLEIVADRMANRRASSLRSDSVKTSEGSPSQRNKNVKQKRIGP